MIAFLSNLVEEALPWKKDCQTAIIFTGGATESNNFILQGIALQAKKENIPHFIISPLEHSSVRENIFFF